MSLTKKDITQIKGIVGDEIENLARIVAKGFEMVDKRFEQVDKRFEQIDNHLEHIDNHIEHIDARLDTIEHDIVDIKGYVVNRNEFEEVLERLGVLEKKVGIRKSSARVR